MDEISFSKDIDDLNLITKWEGFVSKIPSDSMSKMVSGSLTYQVIIIKINNNIFILMF